MSDQFYRYLSKELFDYFDNNGLMKGDKFYIQFDENTQIINFYNSIKEYGINHFLFEEFSYKHNQGDEFLTYSVNCNGIKLVVVESTTISDDYLVTLRNQVGAQNGVWENTALLIIYDEAKDSIFNGMGNLANEGMPLNVNSISENLEDKITGSKTLNKPSKEIIRFYLKNIKEDIFQTTIWDYKNVLSIIESGKITPEDLYELKLFPDTNLKDYNAHKMQSRLKENFELFDEIETYRKYGDLNEELKKSFSERGVRVLKRDDWYLTDFKDIKDFKKKGVIQPLNYEENHDKKTEEGLIYWERPLSYTKAGMRKRHIIVFNENNSNIVTFNFAFDQHIKNEFLSSNSKKYASSSGKKLKVKFNVSNNEPTFKQISYKHNNQTNSYYIFNIVVLNASPAIFDSIKSRYTINLKKKRLIITNDENSDDVIFGSGSNLVEKDIEDTDEKIFLYDEDSILILESSPAWAEGSIKCELIYNDNTIPIEITEKSNKPVPVKSSVIWNLKRRNMENFTYNGAKAIQGVNSVYLEDNFKEFLDFESQIINDNIFYGIKEIDGSIKKQDIKFSPDLTNAYNAIFNYYKTFDDTPEDNLPSLVYLNDELKELYKNFLDIFNREISEIKDNDILADFEYKKDLVKIGRIDDDKRIMYSSLSPINIAYQLEISNQCGDDELSNNLAERLIPNNLIPYVYSDLNELYRPIHQDYAHEWLVYERSEDVSIGTTNVFISNVVNEKLTQFVKHFEYLFEVNNSSPLKINLININDDIEVVKGVFNFIRDRLPDKFKTKDVIPVEINIYTDSNKSSFETLFNCDSIDEVRDIFGIIIKSDLLDPIDILHLVQDNITYYHHKLTNEYEYAHISFYKVTSDVEPAYDSMDKMETGLSLNGLISSVASTTKHTDYRTGFGTRNVLDKENILVKSAININELIENSKNKGKNSYSKNRTVVTSITLDDENIEQLYDNSHWVTFIEPTFGIEYFENSNDVIIIHYSDQYTSSSKYDTITVTNEPTQYKKAIFKFLKEKRIYLKDEELNGIIRMFNSINGEWLLKIVSSSGEYDREKLSLISAAKYGLALLNHEDLIWIPISLEEILRITKNLKLDKAKGPISAFVKQGSYSDDLLFIGLNISDDENIKICYHPVEVKIGLNDAGVIKKGKSQIDSTYKLLYDLLNGNSSNFVNKFFRNFFIQLFLSTQQKLLVNEIWDEKHFERIEKFKPKLLNDEYEISYDLEEYIGKGSLFSFKTSCHHQSISSDNSIQIIEIPEEFAYGSLSKSVNDLFNEIQMGNSDIPVNDLLSNVNLDEIESKPYETEFSDESSNFDEDKNDVHVESVGDSIQEHYTDLNEHEDTFTEDSLDSDVADSVDELADFVFASVNRDKVICSLHDNDVLIPSEIASVTGIKSNNVSSLLTSLSDLGLVVCINPRYTVGRKYKLTYLGHEVYDKLVVLKETSDNVVNVNIDSNVDIDKVKNTYDDDTILKSHAYVSASNYREKVMNVLYGNDVLMPKQIAEYSDILPNHISKVLRELSDNNLIVCINPESRKGRLYKLTPFGNNVCNALRNSNNENSDEKTLSFDSTEVESSYDEDTILKSLAYVSASNYREKVMNVLYGNDVLMPKQIAEHSDIRSNHISKVLSELKNENIVECINPESRKGKLYKLTPLGVQIYNRLNNSDSISSDNDSIEIPHEELEIDRGSEVLIDIPDDGNNNVDNNDSTEHHIDLKDDVGLSKINNVSAADLKDVRALIGTAEDSNHEIYWEFGSPDINNRHMLIEGASGYGKSYFIQRMLKELSNQGIPSIIVDYTNGFKKSKLEPEFKESLEGRIEQHKVMFKKFPLNPFKKYLIEDDDEFIPEPDYNVAGRFKNIINTVYNFGDQQQMAIYNAVISGLSKYGDEMDLIKFKEELIKQDSTHATSTLSKLTQFLDINPFKTDDFDWSCLDEMDGKIRIIQLAGLSKDIQMVITEFVLLDLWNYKVNVGGEQHPFIVVLDEAQNLDFSEGSSSYNILKEGRKFGWSGWFATQFLKGAMKSDEINTLENANEKIYFHPTDNSISDIAIKLSKDGSDKKYWEQKLSKLNKGQAIVHGHLRNSDGKVYSARPVCVDISKIGIDKMEIDTNRDDNDLENTDLTNFKISDKVDSKEIYVDNNIDVDEISNDYFLELDDEFHEEDMKFIKKNGNKYEIYKTINGIRKFYGSFDNLFDAQNRRNELIGDNWGYSTDELPAPGRKPKYGKYIISHNGFYKICKFVDGQQRYIGKFDSLEDAKEMREYLIKNHWDLSLLPEEMLDDKRIHNIRKIKGRYIVVNTIDGVKKYYDSFDTYEEAKEYLDYLIENNWKVNEDIEEEKIDEFVYLINGKYVVRNEIDGKQKVYGEFDDMDEALQYRIECMRKAWKL